MVRKKEYNEIKVLNLEHYIVKYKPYFVGPDTQVYFKMLNYIGKSKHMVKLSKD